MAGIGAYIAGGLLSGVGAGMAKQQEVDDLARRDAALDKARREQTAEQYKAAGQNDAESDLRSRDTQLQVQAEQQNFAARQGDKAAKAASASAQQKRIWEIEDREDGQEFELRKERVRIAAQTSADIAKLREEARAKGTDVFDIKTDDAGVQTVIYRDGTEKPLKSRGQTKKSTAGSDLFGPTESSVIDPARTPMKRPPLSSFDR